jgi:hypothetical protein
VNAINYRIDPSGGQVDVIADQIDVIGDQVDQIIWGIDASQDQVGG